MKKLRLVIISGPSGTGKSTALNILEDLGFFCVDNLPTTLLPKFLELCLQTLEDISKVAMVIDIRERGFLKDFPAIFDELKRDNYKIDMIYLESMDEILVRRFKETRRRHPLSDGNSPLEGIKMEREYLRYIKGISEKIIDTSDMNVHELKSLLRGYFSPVSEVRMTVNLVSFSYRYGIPTDADLMLDVRFLPNPFFVKELKELDGNDKRIEEFILKQEKVKIFLEKIVDLLNFLMDLYRKEGKSYLTIAIGCTGGKHRSVCIINLLSERIYMTGNEVKVRHRDIDKS
ncbi:MAG: RNase adapter RapZ [Thermodesulfobacteriota bacterium]